MALQVVATKNAMAVKFGELATHGTVFTTDAGATPGTEPTGGGFARKPLTWSAPTNGVITASAQFTVSPGTIIVSTGWFNSLAGGTYIEGSDNATVTVEGTTVTVDFKYTQV